MGASLASVAAVETRISRKTELGYLGVAVCDGKVIATTMGNDDERSARRRLEKIAAAEDSPSAGTKTATLADDELAEDCLARLESFAGGEPEVFADLPVVLTHLTPFQRRVVAACRAIPYGKVKSYGEVAALAGSPGAARAVGQVMASNRLPLIVPCHRVVAAGGGLGGFSAPHGKNLKRRLLEMEAAAAE